MERKTKILSVAGFLAVSFLLFAGIGFSDADTLLDVPGIEQEQSNWCWAASAQATLEYYGQNVAQCEIVNWGWGRTDCCAKPSSSDCDKGGYVGSTPNNPGKDVLGHWGVNSTYVGSALPQATVVSEIDSGRPIEIIWTLSLCPLAICDGAHALVVLGYAMNGQYLDYLDPTDGEYHRDTYTRVMAAYPHTWTESFRITTNRAGTPIYEGLIDGSDCNSIRGWAWNEKEPNTSVNVDIYDGGTKLTSVAANLFRQDLVNAGKGNGYHGFSYATPSSLKNGAVHSISVTYAGTSTTLSGSPKTLSCNNYVTYSISGTIHSGGNTGPVLSGVTVSIAGKTTTSSTTGMFSIVGIPAGTYAFTVSKVGYDAYANPAYYVGSNISGLNFYLTPQTQTTGGVYGKLHNGSASGPALSGVSVTCAGKSTTAGSDGSFSLSGIKPGAQILSLSKTGYQSYSTSVTITAGQNYNAGDRWLVFSVNPTIAQSPMSAPSGTNFSQWGTGFTPNSTATVHFKKPDGTEYPSASQSIKSDGSFSITYAAPTSKAPGTYTWWAVDGPTGKASNSVSYTITVNPVIAQTPMSGPTGTTFSQWGTGFTANSTATLHFRKPDGTEYPTASQAVNSSGTFSTSYTAPSNKPKGAYSWWGIDGPTGKVSNTVSYTIN